LANSWKRKEWPQETKEVSQSKGLSLNPRERKATQMLPQGKKVKKESRFELKKEATLTLRLTSLGAKIN